MKSYRQVEKMLYNHFDKIKSKEKYESSLYRTRKRIEEIQKDLKECNFELNSDMAGIDYSRELVSTSEDNSSSMEKALIREETKLERELDEEKRYKFTLKRKIRNLQKQIDHVEIILEQLPVNYTKVIELLYDDKLSYRAASYVLHCTHVTVGNYKKDVIERLMKLL